MNGMDSSVRESLALCRCKDDVASDGPEKLLDECWFFNNLLDRKKIMSRAFSYPSTSSNYGRDNMTRKSFDETYESIKKMSGRDESWPSNLIRAPSMTPCAERKDDKQTTKGSDDGRNELNRETSSMNLQRQPSLPTSFVTEELHDEDTEFSMGKLIRQASLNNPNTMHRRSNPTKGAIASPNLSRHQQRIKPKQMEGSDTEFSMGKLIRQASLNNSNNMNRQTLPTKGTIASASKSRHQSVIKPEQDSPKLECSDKIRPQRVMSQLKTQKSLSALESKELQGFKDLGFDFDDKDLKPGSIGVTPGLQEKKRMEENEQKNTGRLHRTQSWAPPVPKKGGNISMEEDLKAQIKFWARAVASNVRQEC